VSWDFSFSIRLEILQDQFGLWFPITLSNVDYEIETNAYFY